MFVPLSLLLWCDYRYCSVVCAGSVQSPLRHCCLHYSHLYLHGKRGVVRAVGSFLVGDSSRQNIWYVHWISSLLEQPLPYERKTALMSSEKR
jgi:hypothetical protein